MSGVFGNATSLNVAVTGDSDLFHHLKSNMKIGKHFDLTLHTVNKSDLIQSCTEYNLIFYSISVEDISDVSLVQSILDIGRRLVPRQNYLFVVLNDCRNLGFDDDGELVLNVAADNKAFNRFAKNLDELDDKVCFLFKCNKRNIDILHKFAEEGSIISFEKEEINRLATMLVKKHDDLTDTDKKREVRLELKKNKIEDLLAEQGYGELLEIFVKIFKIINQKRMVVQNYLRLLRRADIRELAKPIEDIHSITWLKSDMYDDLLANSQSIILSKLELFWKSHEQVQDVAHQMFLSDLVKLASKFRMDDILIRAKEIYEKVNAQIIEFHKKKVDKTTDLAKIGSYLEALNADDTVKLFDQIRSQPKIFDDNIGRMDQWILFLKKSLEMNIPKESVCQLMEDIIIHKISHYSSHHSSSSSDISTVYPQCLQVLLLSNLDYSFIIKKLYMYLSYSLRYSGRNMAELIMNLDNEKYNDLLKLENLLLEICKTMSN